MADTKLLALAAKVLANTAFDANCEKIVVLVGDAPAKDDILALLAELGNEHAAVIVLKDEAAKDAADFEQKLCALHTEHSKLQTLHETLTADYNFAKTAYDELLAESKGYVAANEQLTLQVEKLSTQVIELPQAPAKSAKTFVHAATGDEYEFTMPGLNHRGEIITADHVLASEALQQQLVEMSSGFIRKLTK